MQLIQPIAKFMSQPHCVGMQIDHDPKELSRKAIKFVAVFTAIVTLAIAIPMSMGIRWVVGQMPITLVALIGGLMVGCCIGVFIGRWDALRGQRTPGNDG